MLTKEYVVTNLLTYQLQKELLLAQNTKKAQYPRTFNQYANFVFKDKC